MSLHANGVMSGIGESETVGTVLRKAREGCGASIVQVAREIRVGVGYIEALEGDRYEDLPPGPYVKGFLDAYAAFLGLDAEELFQLYEQAARQELDGGRGHAGPPFHRKPRQRVNWRDWTIPVILAAGSAVFLMIRRLLPPSMPEFTESPAAPPRVVTEAVSPPTSPLRADIPAADTVAAPGHRSDGGVWLLLKSEGATWVEERADGGEQKRHELQLGENLELTAQSRLEITLGDAGLMRLTVNSRELGFVGFKGETKGGLVFEAPKVGEAGGLVGPRTSPSSPGRENPAGD